MLKRGRLYFSFSVQDTLAPQLRASWAAVAGRVQWVVGLRPCCLWSQVCPWGGLGVCTT